MSTEMNTTKKTRTPSPFASAKDFVIAYVEASKAGKTLNDFAAGCGMKPLSIRSRVQLLKKKGVHLPDLAKPANSGKKGRAPIDVNELNALIFGAK